MAHYLAFLMAQALLFSNLAEAGIRLSQSGSSSNIFETLQSPKIICNDLRGKKGNSKKSSTCDIDLENIKYWSNQPERSPKHGSLLKFFKSNKKSFLECNSTLRALPESDASVLEILKVNEYVHQTESEKKKIEQENLDQFSTLEIKEGINREIERFSVEKQPEIIQDICGIGFPKTFDQMVGQVSHAGLKIKVRKNRVEEFRDRAQTGKLTSENLMRCFLNLTELWKYPKKVTQLLRKNRKVSKFLDDSNNTTLAENFVVMSYLKNIRAQIAISYFRTALTPHLASQLGVPEEDIKSGFMGFGFNRLFSPKNFMGASQTSDVDFNLVFNDQAIPRTGTTDPQEREKEVENFKVRTLEALNQSKRYFFDVLRLPLEINKKFTVRSVTEFNKAMDPSSPSSEGAKNFMATVLGNQVHLFGSQDLHKQLFNTVNNTIPKSEVERRVYQQYVGEESLKGSLEIIRHIDRVKDPHMHETFEGNYIGMPENRGKEHQGNWIFSTKYALMRLYDTKPDDHRAIRLNELALNFQYLLVNYLTMESTSADEIEKRYDKITAKDFAKLYVRYPEEVKGIIRNSCETKLVSQGVCTEFEALQSDDPVGQTDKGRNRWSKTPEPKLSEFGKLYFTDVFNSAADLAENLKPKS